MYHQGLVLNELKYIGRFLMPFLSFWVKFRANLDMKSIDPGEKIKTYRNQTEAMIKSLAFSPDDKTFASGGSDARIELWNIESEQALKKFTLLAHLIRLI